jgi:protocatechuate 3,4-dioxygenase beta subunit
VALSLRLVDAASGKPIAGARAAVTLRTGSRIDPREAVTDPDGVAEIPGAAPGRASIEIQAAGYITGRIAADLEGERAAAEVRLARGAVLEGEVVGPAGDPLEGARIRAFRLEGEGPEGASATTGTDGGFALRGLEPGAWRLTAARGGFRTRSLEVSVPGERLLIELAMDPGFDVVVVDPDGSPVAGARVSIVSRTGGASAGARSARTGNDGRVHLAGLPPEPAGELALEARHPEHLPARIVRKAAELEGAPLVIRFERGGEIAGRVVDASGAPVPNAEVSLAVAGEKSRRSLGTTASGEFRFRKLPAGSHDIVASTPRGGRGLLRGVEVAEGGAVRDLEIPLEAGPGIVAGRIVDGEGKGVALARVELVPEGGGEMPPLRTVSGDGGAFRFEGLSAPGDGGYRLEAGGSKLSAAEVRGVRAGDESLEVVVERLGSIKGIIDSREPVPGYAIRARKTGPDGGKAFERTFRFTSRDLWFRIRGLAPGTYDLTLLVGNEARASVEGVKVAAGAESGPVEMRLRASSPASG